MSQLLQHAIAGVDVDLMSAEQTNIARAYDKWIRGAASHFKRDEERFLLMYFGRSIQLVSCLSKRSGQRRAERWNQRLVSEESAFYTQIGAGEPGFERRRRALRRVAAGCMRGA